MRQWEDDKWEYMEDEISSHVDSHWAALGSQGWELIAIIPNPAAPGIYKGYFKRKLNN